ncbi:MAG: hypothetical protein M1826_002591 [Phylliscum demangeonii]|nr:MAG: hypothetical protein M1826_002591 [Phylliscum demangeonii]
MHGVAPAQAHLQPPHADGSEEEVIAQQQHNPDAHSRGSHTPSSGSRARVSSRGGRRRDIKPWWKDSQHSHELAALTGAQHLAWWECMDKKFDTRPAHGVQPWETIPLRTWHLWERQCLQRVKKGSKLDGGGGGGAALAAAAAASPEPQHEASLVKEEKEQEEQQQEEPRSGPLQMAQIRRLDDQRMRLRWLGVRSAAAAFERWARGAGREWVRAWWRAAGGGGAAAGRGRAWRWAPAPDEVGRGERAWVEMGAGGGG